MSLDQELYTLLSSPDYVPLPIEAISDELHLGKKDNKRLKRLIHKMLDEGEIAKIKGNQYCIPKDADLVSGIIKFRQSGSAVLIPDDPKQAEVHPSLDIHAEDTWVAFHGDRVLVRLIEPIRSHRKKQGKEKTASTARANKQARVIRILKRSFETITGTLKRARLFYYVIPDDPRIIQDILVPAPEDTTFSPQPKAEDKVVVLVHEWEQRHLNPEGEIVEILGKTHEPSAEFKAILHKHKLNPSFSETVLNAVKKIPNTVQPRQITKRYDARNLFTFTIDPDDAKDFDDALSIEYLPESKTRVGIHIADVSAYVKTNSIIDKEAQERGNSTYLVGCVIPMLPHALSNGICSLVEGEDRLTKSVFVTFDKKANVLKTEFTNSVIHSNKRLTYHQAYALLKNDDIQEAIAKAPAPAGHQTGHTGKDLKSISTQEVQLLQKAIRKLWSLGSKLRKARFKSGSLELDMPEVKIYVDEQGYAHELRKIENDESHQLIEEFMLTANELVAKALFDAGMPFISRVHDQPDAEKLNDLRDYMITMGIVTGDLSNSQELGKLLKKVKKHPQSHTLKVEILRSLKQACYRAETDGHYGLAKTFYTHFTSPIRRYSDLIVHRIFDNYLIKHKVGSAPSRPHKAYPKGNLDSLSQHLSVTEQRSTEAERESVKTKLLEYFERELDQKFKQKFPAYITDIRNHGMFIELADSMTFGLIHVSTLKGDFYHVANNGQSLVGRRTQKEYNLGQRINVVVERVDRFKRQIDFKIDEGPQKAFAKKFKRTASKKETAPNKRKKFSRKRRRQ